MSEQMSARELWKILAGVISEAFKNDVRKRYTIDEAEVRVIALILADRKATVERCRDAMYAVGWINRGVIDKALDAVLEETPHQGSCNISPNRL